MIRRYLRWRRDYRWPKVRSLRGLLIMYVVFVTGMTAVAWLYRVLFHGDTTLTAGQMFGLLIGAALGAWSTQSLLEAGKLGTSQKKTGKDAIRSDSDSKKPQ